MKEELKIQDARKRFEFQRIHRLGKKKGNAPRAIIARFLRYTDREEVLAQARVTKGQNIQCIRGHPKRTV